MSSSALALAKAELRAHHHALRLHAARQRDSWQAANTRLSQQVARYVHAQRHGAQPLRIAAYVPLADEPGAEFLLDVLAGSADELWLPICKPGFQLHWALYEGPDSLTVRNPRLPVSEPIAEGLPSAQCIPNLDLMVVPALAISRNGFRLGKGAGFYDRAITAAHEHVADNTGTTMPELVGVVFADEICDSVPHDEHDRAVDKIITECGVRSLETAPQ